MNDKLLTYSIPRIYHQDEFTPFLRAIDLTIGDIEQQIDNITTLIDIDSCPDFNLPYLASLTKCPLWGQNPLLWRKQIKNWPYVCRMKGTKKAMRYFFDALGLITEKIDTYWRNNKGMYVTERPQGDPYIDTTSGLWHNSKTHYFGVELKFDNNIKLTDKDVEGLPTNILSWINSVKPAHAELLGKIIWNKYFDEKTIKTYTGMAIVQSGTKKIKTALPSKATISHRAGGAVVLSGKQQIKTRLPTKHNIGMSVGGMITMSGRMTIGARLEEM